MSFAEIDTNFLIDFLTGGGLSVLLLILGHTLFPDRTLPTSVLGLLSRYAYGTFMLWLGKAIWLALAGYSWKVILGLLVIDVAGGTAVIGCYGFDKLYAAVRQSWMARSTDDELKVR